MKRAWVCWAGIVIVGLGGCPEESYSRQAGTFSGHGGPASTAGTGSEGREDVEDDGGVDSCEPPRAAQQRASFDYCERCAPAELASCCTVQGLCCREEWGELAPLEFAACASGSATCDLPAVAFGPEGASYQGGSYVPAASAGLRSGLVMTSSVDASDRIRFGARLIRSDQAECTSCSELVGVGLSRLPLPDDASNMAPELSILVSSELSRLVVASGSTTRWSLAIDTAPHDVALERDPSGVAKLSIDGVVHTVLNLQLPAGPLYPMIFGRRDTRVDPARGVRITSAFASSTRCESTAKWPERAALTLPVGQTLSSDERPRAPSLIVLDGVRWLAYERAGTIRALRLVEAGEAGEALEITAPAGGEAQKLADPEWVLEGDRLAIYYTAVDAVGLRSLGRARFPGAQPAGGVEHSQLLAASSGVLEVFGPSAARGRDGELLLLATAIDQDGTQKLVLMKNLGDASDPSFALEGAQTLLAVERRAAKQEFAALGSGDLVYRRAQYQVYFAASGASRWAVSLLTSLDLKQWLSAGPVLEGVPGSKLDDSGVQDPDAVVDGDEFSLYYVAHSAGDATSSAGESWRLARAERVGRAICGGEECAAGKDCVLDGASTARCTP